MTTDGGGWTLVAVSSDDGSDTWTWNNRHYWDTDTSTFGSLDHLHLDFKSDAFHKLVADDLLFRHAPSNIWASYHATGNEQTLAEQIASAGGPIAWNKDVDGFAMTAGTLTKSGDLLSTRLFFNAADQDSDSADDHAWGPTWCTSGNSVDTPFDDPGFEGSLGPLADLDQNGGLGDSQNMEFSALGFGKALGLNSGAQGTGQNHMQVYVRSQ